MDNSLPNKNLLRGVNESKQTRPIEIQGAPKQITHFTARLKLPETSRRKSKRQFASAESPPRMKSEQELREEAAWKQVEETGKPVVLDDNLHLPDGTNLTEAIQYLLDNLREETADAWDKKLSEVWEYISRSTEERIRQKAQEEGKLEYYNPLPTCARTALLESMIRQQWDFPEVPFEQLLEKWKNASNEVEDTPSKKKKKKGAKKTRKLDFVQTQTRPCPVLLQSPSVEGT